jgi:hypothetical protein
MKLIFVFNFIIYQLFYQSDSISISLIAIFKIIYEIDFFLILSFYHFFYLSYSVLIPLINLKIIIKILISYLLPHVL